MDWKARIRSAFIESGHVPDEDVLEKLAEHAGLTQDVRHAAHLLRRQPRDSLLAGLTMALGIGATTSLFSVTYGVLLKPLARPDADRLVQQRDLPRLA